jgi:addiction module HigA family antidote
MEKIPTVKPGEILSDWLEEEGIKPSAMADAIGVDRTAILNIIKGTRRITAVMSIKLGKFFGIEQGFWFRLQGDYDLREAKSSVTPDMKIKTAKQLKRAKG